jgi:hypothetical protein
MTDTDPLARANWRKSSYSGSGGTGGGNCIEIAPLADGTIALRNSNNPQAGTLFFTPTEMHAWIKDCKAGKFDDFS